MVGCIRKRIMNKLGEKSWARLRMGERGSLASGDHAQRKWLVAWGVKASGSSFVIQTSGRIGHSKASYTPRTGERLHTSSVKLYDVKLRCVPATNNMLSTRYRTARTVLCNSTI